MAVLAAAKKPVVAPEFDEKNAVISARQERANARDRHNAPKKLAAAKQLCEDTRAQLNIAAAIAAVRFPIQRTVAFRKSKK